jgi:hypothetical protein
VKYPESGIYAEANKKESRISRRVFVEVEAMVCPAQIGFEFDRHVIDPNKMYKIYRVAPVTRWKRAKLLKIIAHPKLKLYLTPSAIGNRHQFKGLEEVHQDVSAIERSHPSHNIKLKVAIASCCCCE